MNGREMFTGQRPPVSPRRRAPKRAGAPGWPAFVTTCTFAPSVNSSTPSSTIRSEPSRPDVTATRSPSAGPSAIRLMVTVLSGFTA